MGVVGEQIEKASPAQGVQGLVELHELVVDGEDRSQSAQPQRQGKKKDGRREGRRLPFFLPRRVLPGVQGQWRVSFL